MKKVITAILLLLVVVSFFSLAKALLLPSYQDFQYYYYAAKAALHNVNPYLNGGLYTGYLYPPICLIFFYPFQLLPLVIAEKIWISFSIVLLIFSVYLLLKLAKYKIFSNLSLLIYLLVFLFFPVKFTFGMGQINIIVLFFVTLAFYFYQKDKEELSGIFFGLSLLTKYFPLFIIPYLILRKKWKLLIYLLITVVVCLLLGFVFINQKINIYFYTHTFLSLLDSNGDYYFNQALSGFLAREFHSSVLRSSLKLILSVLLLFVTFLLVYRKKFNNKGQMLFEFGIILNTNLLLNSFTWQHHFVWILPSLIFTLIIIYKKKLPIIYYVLLALIYLMLSFNIKNPPSVPEILQSHAFYGALLLWCMDLYLLKKVSFAKD